MAGSSGRSAKGRGANLAVALLGLGLLAGVAFLVGALAGLVWKEPDLLLAYVRGETTEIAWTTVSDDVPAAPVDSVAPVVAGGVAPDSVPAGANPPAVAAAPREAPVQAAAKPPTPASPAKPRAAAPSATSKTPTAPTPPAPAAVAAAPPAVGTPARIAIQVGAFGERGAAEGLRADLQGDGYPAYVAATASDSSPRWRVRVGPYPSREKAEGIAARLKRNRRLPTWVLDEDAE